MGLFNAPRPVVEKQPTDFFPQVFWNLPETGYLGTNPGGAAPPMRTAEERAKKKVPRPKYVPEEKSADQLFDEQRHIAVGPLFEEGLDALHGSNIRISGGSDGAPPPFCNSFASCGFDAAIEQNLHRLLHTQPTLIQKAVIPLIQKTQDDLMAHAHTGTGKSAAFLLPLINEIQRSGIAQFSGDSPHSILVAPTRELVRQLYDDARELANGTSVGVAVAYGDIPMGISLRNVRNGCDLLVTTIGRLIHYLRESIIKLDKLRFLVLDEGDKFLKEQDALKTLRQIVAIIKQKSSRHRTLMFSATFERDVQEFADEFLKPNYYFVSIGELNQTVRTVSQTILKTSKYEKMAKLVELLQHKSIKSPNANQETGPLYKTEKTIVFINGRRECDRLGIALAYKGYSVITLNSSRTQEQRTQAQEHFTQGIYDILVSTDVCSRGLNFPNVRHVLNFDMPRVNRASDYVHRIGRTGRAGNLGRSTTFFDPHADVVHVEFLYQILEQANQVIPDWLQDIMDINRAVRREAAEEERQRMSTIAEEEEEGPNGEGNVQQPCPGDWDDEGIDFF